MTHRTTYAANPQTGSMPPRQRKARQQSAAVHSQFGNPHPLSQGLLVLGGLSALGFGLFRGEAAIVLQKAVKVCLECIGIG